MERDFTLEYWSDDGWHVGHLKEVRGVFSQGETLQDFESNIRDAYRMMMENSDPPWAYSHKTVGILTPVS